MYNVHVARWTSHLNRRFYVLRSRGHELPNNPNGTPLGFLPAGSGEFFFHFSSLLDRLPNFNFHDGHPRFGAGGYIEFH